MLLLRASPRLTASINVRHFSAARSLLMWQSRPVFSALKKVGELKKELQKLDQEISKTITQSQIDQHVPGKTPQTNTIADRIPKFPLKREAIPSLIPRPDVPKPGSNLTKMVQILHHKEAPELIYEAESHRLYFLFCGAFAFVALTYGLIFLEWAFDSAYTLYKQNEDNLPNWQNTLLFIGRNIATLTVFAIPAAFAVFFLTIPTRLIRRIWYIPARANETSSNKEELVRFTTHPFFPGRPTPVRTVPLASLNRSYRTKIFTNEGFYLTNDKGSFLFLLQEGTKRIPWIVDRLGFFWGDGRVFDHLFGKESIEEADKGISYDDKVGAINEKIRLEKRRLRKEKGLGWQLKEKGKYVNSDIRKLVSAVKGQKKIGPGKE